MAGAITNQAIDLTVKTAYTGEASDEEPERRQSRNRQPKPHRAVFETKNKEGTWVNGARVTIHYGGRAAPFKLDVDRTPSMQSKERSKARRGKGFNQAKRDCRANNPEGKYHKGTHKARR